MYTTVTVKGVLKDFLNKEDSQLAKTNLLQVDEEN
jgi:hypothetical protein